MFDLGFLDLLRNEELTFLLPYLPPGVDVLEIGGGTGQQAKLLQAHGCRITSIDVVDSPYSPFMVFPVITYNGTSIPLDDNSVDVVFSSNVLEHVVELPELMRDVARVLRPGGRCVHTMPSASWRVWTALAHYVSRAALIWKRIRREGRSGGEPSDTGELPGSELTTREPPRSVASRLRPWLLPARHGEHGNALTEVYSFSARAWRRRLTRLGYGIVEVRPMGLFYTGEMVVGRRLSFRWRGRLARILGSSSILYVITPPSDV